MAQADLLGGLLAGDVEDLAAGRGEVAERHAGERRLADAGRAAEQDERAGDQAAAQDAVDLVQAGPQARGARRVDVLQAGDRGRARAAGPAEAGGRTGAAAGGRHGDLLDHRVPLPAAGALAHPAGLAVPAGRAGVDRRGAGHAVIEGRPGGGRSAPARHPGARGEGLASAADVTPSPAEIRLARPEDLPAVVAIYNATIPGRMATAQLEPVTVQERQGWFDGHTPDRRPMWVAEADGEVVAWAGLTDFHARAAYHATAQASIYVDERARGQGLGGRLLDHMIAHAPAAGVTALVGLIFADNAPSLGLFESRGFERWGHMPQVAETDGNLRDLVYVGRHV